MKAYIIRKSTLLFPYAKTASDLAIKAETVGSRLAAQLRSAGYTPEHIDSFEGLYAEPGSIVVQDNILMSSNFIRRFVQAIPYQQKNYQCVVDIARHPMLVEKDPEPEWSKIELYYIGEPASPSAVAPLNMSPKVVHVFDRGLPARMHQMVDIRAYFCDFYAQQIDYWFDFQKAISMYSREYVSRVITLARQYLPNVLVNWGVKQRWLMERSNIIGKNCNIHPTAILEGCIIGDNVEIGPFSYLRSTVVDDDCVLRENTATKMAYLGKKSFIMGSDIANCYIGAESSIVTPILYNSVFGESSFISGGSGFADFNVGSGAVTAMVPEKEMSSGMTCLGSCVGDRSFIGANMIFAPGRVIPNDTNLLDYALIKDLPTEPGGTYVLSGKQLLQIPGNFTGKKHS